jgi:hypothetical protein
MMLRSRAKLAAAAVAIVVGCSVASAEAASIRYASPTGSGSACTQASPCDAGTAIGGAGSGDTVKLAPGDYGSSASPIGPITLGADNVSIEGQVVQGDTPSRPVLHIHGTSATAMGITGAGDSMSDVDVLASGGNGGLALGPGSGTTISRVTVLSDTPLVCDAFTGSATITDTVCGGVGSVIPQQALTLESAAYTLRNVTAFVPAGTGLQAMNNAHVTAVNSVLHGTTDVFTNTGATVTVSHCNYAAAFESSVVDGGANQHALPSFIDAINGNYREQPGSVTVDAGVDDPANGPLDLADAARKQGAHTDIGAFEAPGPAAQTGAAAVISSTAASLGGIVNLNGYAGSFYFQYGPSSSYGHSTALEPAGNGYTPVAVNGVLTGLTPATTYHYRLAVMTPSLSVYGTDQTFTTPPAPAPPTITSSFKLLSGRATVSRQGRLSLRVACQGGTTRCAGTLTLAASVRGYLNRHGRVTTLTISLARKRVAVRAGSTTVVSLRLNRAARTWWLSVHRRHIAAVETLGAAQRLVTLVRGS